MCEAVNKLGQYVNVTIGNLGNRDMKGCGLNIDNHMNGGSHTAVTCLQRIRFTADHGPAPAGITPVPSSIQKALYKHAMKGTAAFYKNLCNQSKSKACLEKKCEGTRFAKCPAQRKHYYNTVSERLVDEFDALEEYKTAKANGSLVMTDKDLKGLVIAIVMNGLTSKWTLSNR